MNKYNVTILDKHGDEDVVEVYATDWMHVPSALDSSYGDDYLAIVDVELAN